MTSHQTRCRSRFRGAPLDDSPAGVVRRTSRETRRVVARLLTVERMRALLQRLAVDTLIRLQVGTAVAVALLYVPSVLTREQLTVFSASWLCPAFLVWPLVAALSGRCTFPQRLDRRRADPHEGQVDPGDEPLDAGRHADQPVRGREARRPGAGRRARRGGGVIASRRVRLQPDAARSTSPWVRLQPDALRSMPSWVRLQPDAPRHAKDDGSNADADERATDRR